MRLASRDLDDVGLVARTPREPSAFGELYRRYERDVLVYFLHWTRSGEISADLTAETFASALASIAGYDAGRGDFRAWLFGIARHVLAHSLEAGRVEDLARRRLGMSPVEVDGETVERIEALASLDGLALKLLEDLPEPIREAVRGRVLEEREYRELAQSLSCSESLVRQRVKRGLSRLRDRLEVTR